MVLAAAQEGNGGVAPDYVYSSFQLNNSDDEIILLTPEGLVVDQVYFDTNSFPSESGVAMSLDGDSVADQMNDYGANCCNALSAYVTAGNLGTPGEANPLCNIPSTCGNGTCEPVEGEQCNNCPGDCGVCSSCDTGLGAGCEG